MRLLWSGLLGVALVTSASATAPDVTARLIESETYYHQPLAPCELPTAVIRIAKAVRVPLGVEELPADCMRSRRSSDMTVPPREKVFLTGKTVGEALDELVAADPRYRWSTSDGVIVLRPTTAWANRAHFLHRTLPSFSVTDENMGAALDEWRRAMWGESAPRSSDHMRMDQRTAEGSRRFSVVVDNAATAIAALDQIVGAHGALYWQVRYCQPRAEALSATVWLWTLEDTPTGLGVPLPERVAVMKGQRVNPCAGTK